MNALAKKKQTVDEFLQWATTQEGRYELVNGEIYMQAAERAAHLETKLAIAIALRDAIKRASLPCFAVPDGATVRITDNTAYEPDALVYCGEKVRPDAIEFPNPVIVVEVLSPSSIAIDMRDKLRAYFSVPSIAHYLIADPDERILIHHARGQGDNLLTRVVAEGTIQLDPPGIALPVSALFS